jgi:hypothetical protein
VFIAVPEILSPDEFPTPMPSQILCFVHLLQRHSGGPISRTTSWTKRSIVLDVPSEAKSLHYGFFLKGFG